MLNHKFYAYDENFNIQFVQETDFIRISNLLIESLKDRLNEHLFTDYYSEKKVHGLSDSATLLTNNDILYIKKCLISVENTLKEKEIVKFLFFLEDCISIGKQVLHVDGSPSTVGLVHRFLLCDKVPENLDPRNFRNNTIKIQDQFIGEYYDVFKDVNMYWDTVENLDQGFNYYGITIISPDIAKQLLFRMTEYLEGNRSEAAEYFIGDDYETLKMLLNKGITKGVYIIHFGI
ncbi:hypothetical protein IW492_14130 [Enterococcus sp. BWB1-3]|uniref:hypothetical protein n=1 Tax=Enterococcus sp. BWB1-3 TaxID=2787713 RepID=UPI001923743C|nr:hypothetical protein [Enterococcus sp. BWB1-3]MBL1230371.1 hypothetical protein [Enterococcus sp. BWB1-3]